MSCYALEQLHFLARFVATDEGQRLLATAPIRLVSAGDVAAAEGPAILLVADHHVPLTPGATWSVPFNGTALSLYHPLPRPGPQWQALPNEDTPAWWRRGDGALTPAWNMLAIVHDLLTFREDAEIAVRDRHGRLPIEASPRYAAGLTHAPTVNEALALLLDAAASLGRGAAPCFALDGLICPPTLALSHDCDNLRGDDVYTQGARIVRAVRPILRGRPPASRPLRAVVANVLHPRRHYFDDLLRMIAAERARAYASVHYLLNGSGGRLGARGGSAIVGELVCALPPGAALGAHYNYDTFHDERRMRAQLDELAALGIGAMRCGRAHYMRFDPLRTPAFIAGLGIRFDESVGWPYDNSYRAGIAGPFQPRDANRLVELPLTFMDADLARTVTGERCFETMYRHLVRVGGVVSVLFHPGNYANPEFPEMAGVYDAVLDIAKSGGSRSLTPGEFLALAGAPA